MKPEPGRWDQFTLRIFVDAAPEVVMEHWLRPGLVETWFVPTCEYGSRDSGDRCEAGDRYRWQWADGTEERSTVREVAFPQRFRFGWMADLDECTVTISIHEGRTLVELVQVNREPNEADRMQVWMDCKEGWSFYLVNLKSVLEGGIDLRDLAPKVRNLVNW